MSPEEKAKAKADSALLVELAQLKQGETPWEDPNFPPDVFWMKKENDIEQHS